MDLDRSSVRLFLSQLRLGYFDSADQPYRRIGWESVNTPRAQQFNHQAARESTVLLKNNNRPPLDRHSSIRTIAVVGPHSNSTVMLQGKYYGVPPSFITITDGLRAVGDATVMQAIGCHISDNDMSGFAAALALAKSADLCNRLTSREGESNPRSPLS